MRAGELRHRITIKRPPPGQGQKGDVKGADEIIYKDWPCSVKPLNAREIEVAQQMRAEATFAVEMYGDPKRPVQEVDYAEFIDGVTGTADKPRRLNVMGVIDKDQNGVELKLLCGEEKTRVQV